MNTRVLRIVALAVIVLVSLWFLNDRSPRDAVAPGSAASSSSPSTPAGGPGTPPPSIASPVPTPTSDPSTDLETADGEGDPVDPDAPAVPRDAAQAEQFEAYAAAAAEFMSVFARPEPGMSQERWWAQVERRLADVAQDAYAGTDPQSVPFTEVTGETVIVPTDAPLGLLVMARVPTDDGPYLVEMVTLPEGIRVSRATREADL